MPDKWVWAVPKANLQNPSSIQEFESAYLSSCFSERRGGRRDQLRIVFQEHADKDKFSEEYWVIWTVLDGSAEGEDSAEYGKIVLDKDGKHSQGP